MWAVSAGRRLHCVAGRRPCGALFPGAIGGVATLVHRSSLHSVGEYHSRIVERADSCSKRVSYADASRLLSQFVAEGYDAGRLRGFFDYDGDTRLCIDDYFVILQLCKQLELQDLDLLSSLSEDLRLAFVELYATQQPKDAVRSPDSDGNPSAEPERLTQRGSRSRRAFRVDRSSMPPLKDAVMSESHQHQADISHVATCVLFNELHILHDPLFATIGDLLLKHGEDLSLPELDLLLRTYASQHYRDHEFVAALVSRVEDEAGALDPETAVRLYRSLSFLDIMSPSLCAALESRFCERVDTGSGARFGFAAALRLPDLIDVGYAKFVQGSADNESFWFIRGVLEGVARRRGSDSSGTSDASTSTTGTTVLGSISPKQQRKLTALVALLKCISEPCYSTLGDDTIGVLNDIMSADGAYKKFRTTKFVEKVSQHLTKLRIRHETNIYANGLLLDIVEKDRNVVWLCNSYHRFYASTFDPTAESRAVERLIRAFGFKTCPINYYQWGRLKAKRTRFAYIRMARYYALHDQREYDHRYSGWSLPYVWWNTSRQDQMHVSNYIKYDP